MAWAKGFAAGLLYTINMIKKVTGSYFKPILPAFLLNEDCYCSGSLKGDPVNNGWSIVTEESWDLRGTDAIWKDSKIDNKMARSIRVKFACGCSGGGLYTPTVNRNKEINEGQRWYGRIDSVFSGMGCKRDKF